MIKDKLKGILLWLVTAIWMLLLLLTFVSQEREMAVQKEILIEEKNQTSLLEDVLYSIENQEVEVEIIYNQ